MHLLGRPPGGVVRVTKTRAKPRTTPEERRAKVDALAKRYQDWLAEQEDGALAYLAARFDGYSQRNACLIGMQRPEATDVRGYREWLAHGRQVRKGEQGIQILAPITKRTEDGDGELVAVRVAYVFDVTQTDPVEGRVIA
jgi:N-terminal domain of anti-restriction factor ArdC